MALQVRAVSVKQFPESVNDAVERMFLSELGNALEADRPRIVLDCSSLHSLNFAAIHLLLRCLEEAMKRNGDVRLAAVPRASRAPLEAAGLDRLFKVFDTDAEAIRSFQRHSIAVNPLSCITSASVQAAENAA
jgi:anti-sigma B factor antagonist